MKKIMQINNQKDLFKVIDFIHDYNFDSETIYLDSSNSLNIKFERPLYEKAVLIWKFLCIKKIEVPIGEYVLKIHNINKYILKDTERVKFYDFNELIYQENEKCIRVISGIPIEIIIYVSNFEISIEDTEKIVCEKTKIDMGWCC